MIPSVPSMPSVPERPMDVMGPLGAISSFGKIVGSGLAVPAVDVPSGVIQNLVSVDPIDVASMPASLTDLPVEGVSGAEMATVGAETGAEAAVSGAEAAASISVGTVAAGLGVVIKIIMDQIFEAFGPSSDWIGFPTHVAENEQMIHDAFVRLLPRLHDAKTQEDVADAIMDFRVETSQTLDLGSVKNVFVLAVPPGTTGVEHGVRVSPKPITWDTVTASVNAYIAQRLAELPPTGYDPALWALAADQDKGQFLMYVAAIDNFRILAGRDPTAAELSTLTNLENNQDMGTWLSSYFPNQTLVTPLGTDYIQKIMAGSGG